MEQLKMLGLSEARTKLFDLADESKPTLLLRHSSPRAVLVPYAAWVELQVEIEDLKGVIAGYRSRTNSPQLRLPTIDLERNARTQFCQQKIAGIFEPDRNPAFHPYPGDLVMFVGSAGRIAILMTWL